MDAILNNIMLILMMNGSVMIIPGVNFLIVARQSVLNGLLAGVFCALGITAAIVLHAVLAAYSVSVLMTNYPLIFTVIRYLGAGYLFYLGTRFLIASFTNSAASVSFDDLKSHKREAFRSGFLVDLFNPFISIFYISLFSTMMFTGESLFELGCYIGFIFAISIVWFSIVAIFFNHSLLKNRLQNKSRYIQAISGLAMYYFSAKVTFGF